LLILQGIKNIVFVSRISDNSSMKKRLINELKNAVRADDLSALRDEYAHVPAALNVGQGISPPSVGGDLNARIAVVMQDFCSADFIDSRTDSQVAFMAEHGYCDSVKTNHHLADFLAAMGETRESVWCTNAMPFVKSGAMTAPVKARDVAYTVEKYLVPELNIVDAEVVLCLGNAAFDSLRKHYGAAKGVDSFEANGRRFVKLPHPSPLSVNRLGKQNVARMYADAANKEQQ